jgi:CO/xanthine dehydrogenase FAD-binding subunit
MKVFRPTRLQEALAILADHAGDTSAIDVPSGHFGATTEGGSDGGPRGWSLGARRAIPVAGGTDLLVHWPERLEARTRTYIDLWQIEELRRLGWTGDALELGATTTYWDVEGDSRTAATFPMLVDAARQVGAVQIQTRGTWAGNVANASPAADGVPVLMAYDAVLILESRAGSRELALDELYLDYKLLDMRPDEVIAGIRIPRREHAFQRFIKVGSRRAQAIAKVGVALARSEHGWRVVAASVAPTVRRCRTLEAFLDRGEQPAAPEDLLPALSVDVTPIDDLRSSAAYRQKVLAQVLYHALREAGVAR